jgi:predicted RNA-binding protein with PUA-like domain
MGYWLFKTEPDAFSIEDLRANHVEMWDGIRNYQARNMLRDDVKVGDKVFIYHSSCKNIGIAGLAGVVKSGYPDPTQFDPEAKYYDPKSTREKPRWIAVDIQFDTAFSQILPLKDIKASSQIEKIGLVKKGGRLSIMPVETDEWQIIYNMATG